MEQTIRSGPLQRTDAPPRGQPPRYTLPHAPVRVQRPHACFGQLFKLDTVCVKITTIMSQWWRWQAICRCLVVTQIDWQNLDLIAATDRAYQRSCWRPNAAKKRRQGALRSEIGWRYPREVTTHAAAAAAAASWIVTVVPASKDVYCVRSRTAEVFRPSHYPLE